MSFLLATSSSLDGKKHVIDGDGRFIWSPTCKLFLRIQGTIKNLLIAFGVNKKKKKEVEEEAFKHSSFPFSHESLV